MITDENEFLEEFRTLFFRLYHSGCIETKASRDSIETVENILIEVAKALGEEKAETLQTAIIITRQEEGMRLFLEGFRYGMALISDSL